MKYLHLILLLILTGCTDNTRARSFGGNTTIELPAGEKLFDVTWKEANLWYCTRQ